MIEVYSNPAVRKRLRRFRQYLIVGRDARYLSELDTADRQEPTEALTTKATRLTEKLTRLMGKLEV